MCGIAGILSTDDSRILQERLKKMTDSITHRGPDGEGFWMHDRIGFGHRRLCIIDLTPAGAQPMHYLDRYTIIYNGEIYNYLEIKDALQKKGYRFQTNTDTEVLIAAYACYKENCLQYFDGMFAFAIWDRQEQELFAARDRFGEKPFFYYISNNRNEFLFGSEIKTLFAAGAPKEYDGTILLNYLALGWTEHPIEKERTFYRDIHALPPAHYIKIRPGVNPVIKRYWNLLTIETPIDQAAAMDRFNELFHGSVQRRLRSDVPIGTSLSGGLDSSSVIASAARLENSHYTHKSFSAVFPGFIKDETSYIKLVSDQYKLQNYFTTPDAGDIENEFEKFMFYHEQPLSTASVFAQYKVYQLAKANDVTVLLDGQGADEILAGYQKYVHWYLQELWKTNQAAFRKELQALRENNIPFSWNIRNILAAKFPLFAAGQLQRKAMGWLKAEAIIAPEFRAAHIDKYSLYKPVIRSLNDILHFNTCQFGLTELLRYADANGMAHSREVRLPFLNHEMVSFIFSLPAQCKIHQGWSKWLLRKSMAPYLPAPVVWRKEKVGFEPPEELWMKDERIRIRIEESKKKLAALNILTSASGSKKNQSPAVPTTENMNWRCIVAAALIN